MGKLENVERALQELEKKFGKGSVGFLSQRESYDNEFTGVLPTGLLSLDLAIGVGGLPRGRIIELWGPESVGKSTLALGIIAETQANGGLVAYIDAEHALDTDWAKKIGVDIDSLIFSQPDYGEQALSVVESLVRTGAVDLIVVDSVPSLTPKEVLEKGMDGDNISSLARMMSRFLSMAVGLVKKSNCTVLFINQVRDKIGGYGGGETTPGGRALRFYASVRMRIGQKELIKVGNSEFPVGIRSEIVIRKNKVAPPFRKAEIEITSHEGISRVGEVLDYAKAYNIVETKGAWYSYGDIKIGQGRENAKTFLYNNPDILDEITRKVREVLFNGVEGDVVSVD